jgi:hypothetical protein
MATFLQSLQIGQAVSLCDLDRGQLTLVSDGQPGSHVVEINSEYIVVEDEEAGVRSRIPVHLISSVGPAAPVAVPELTPAAA